MMARNLHRELESAGMLHVYAARVARRITVQANGCWTWDKPPKDGMPLMSGGSPIKRGLKQFHVSVRTLLLMTAYGADMRGFRTSRSCCGNPLCVRPLHWMGGQRKDAWLNRHLGEADEQWRRILDMDVRAMPAKVVAGLVQSVMGDGLLAKHQPQALTANGR